MDTGTLVPSRTLTSTRVVTYLFWSYPRTGAVMTTSLAPLATSYAYTVFGVVSD